MIRYSQLPRGWTEAALPDVAEVNPPNPKELPADDTLISFVPMASVEALSGQLDATQLRPWKQVRKGYTRFQNGDVLFAKITPCMENGKAAVARGLSNGIGAGSTEFHVLRLTNAFRPELLLHYLLQEEFRKTARAQMTGTAGQLRVPGRFLDEQTIPVPPQLEQNRIIEALESYFTRLDDVVVTLERVQRNLKRYRASVLNAAVEGRLVSTEAKLARAESRSYEPASVLLERILAERRHLWEEAELTKMTAKGKAPKDDKWKAKYLDPVAPDTTDLPELPEGWCWASVEQLGFIASGQTPDGVTSAGAAKGAIPWYRVGDMNTKGNELLMSVAKEWLTTDQVAALGLHVRPAGTIIFPKRGGAIGTNKKRLLARPSTYDLNTMGIVPVTGIGSFLWMWFNGVDLGSLADGSNVPQINHGDIAPISVPIAPQQEQVRIVDEVKALLSIAEDAISVVSVNRLRETRLRQSILKWAFEGRLVDQDPTDEPATVLLERIRSECISKSAAPTSPSADGESLPRQRRKVNRKKA